MLGSAEFRQTCDCLNGQNRAHLGYSKYVDTDRGQFACSLCSLASKCSHIINTGGENINVAWSPDGHSVGVGNKEDVVTIIDIRKIKIDKKSQFPYEVWNGGIFISFDLLFVSRRLTKCAGILPMTYFFLRLVLAPSICLSSQA